MIESALRRPATVWVVLIVLTVIRLLLAAYVPLTPDEAYYWVWSRHLQPGYLDHPFMVAVWIRLGTWIAGDTPLGVRLLGPLSVLPGSWALFHAARRILPTRSWPDSGAGAVLLLNATLMLGLGSATMTPDTPLLFFVTIFLYALSRTLAQEGQRTREVVWWLVTACALGLAFDSKYTAALIGVGLGCAVLTTRSLRKQPGPWLAIPVLLLAMAPVIFWNQAHHWASFVRQGSRAGDWVPARALQFQGELLAGQIGLATPLVFASFCFGVWACLRSNRLLAWLILIPTVVFVLHAFGDRVQPNWPAVIYPALALAAMQVARPIKWPIISGLILTGAVTLQAICSPVHLVPHRDPVLRLTGGWSAFAERVALEAKAEGATALAADDYGIAAELAFSQHILPVMGSDPRWHLFVLPSIIMQHVVRIAEQRQDSPPRQSKLCREVWQQAVRCYVLSAPTEVRGTLLPGHV